MRISAALSERPSSPLVRTLLIIFPLVFISSCCSFMIFSICSSILQVKKATWPSRGWTSCTLRWRRRRIRTKRRRLHFYRTQSGPETRPERPDTKSLDDPDCQAERRHANKTHEASNFLILFGGIGTKEPSAGDVKMPLAFSGWIMLHPSTKEETLLGSWINFFFFALICRKSPVVVI